MERVTKNKYIAQAGVGVVVVPTEALKSKRLRGRHLSIKEVLNEEEL